MKTLDIILYVIAALCFLLAFFEVSFNRHTGDGVTRTVPNLVALGLLAWVLVPLITTVRS